MRVALAFPGQGVSATAIRSALAHNEDDSLVRLLRERLNVDEWSSLDLLDTRASQPCTYVCSLIAARGAPREDVRLVVGHSLGEITATVYAGAITPGDGLNLVIRRAELCHDRQTHRAGAMVAVMGLDHLTLEWVRRLAAANGGVLEFAALNSPRQAVLSGDVARVDDVVTLVQEHEGIAQVLPIGGAFHSGHMRDAVSDFREAVEGLELGELAVPVLSTIDCALHLEAQSLARNLVRGLVLPVRWLEALHAVKEFGIDEAWDCGPGSTLAKLGRHTGVLPFRPIPQPAETAATGS
jgi:[acyl-carrier-protein] S-malonyltransferase